MKTNFGHGVSWPNYVAVTSTLNDHLHILQSLLATHATAKVVLNIYLAIFIELSKLFSESPLVW